MRQIQKKELKKKNLDVKMSTDEDDDDERPSFNKKADNKSKTPVLDAFSKDLTRFAEEGKIDPIIGREKEIERVSQILSRKKKNNPILIGEPGVGKSAIAEGLALRIVRRKVSRVLFNKRIVTLDLASMVAGTKYRGQFEERIKALMAEVEKDPNIILFIDEIHTIIGAGGASGSLDASNMLKPALARGEVQVIGATTLDEYRKHIEKDGALERRFQRVIVEPATEEETLQILNNIKDRYESHHNVSYSEDAIKACVSLTSRYVTDRFLPDKAIDALDEVGARVHMNNINVPKEILTLEDKLQEIKDKKMEVIRIQKYEDAAKFRDAEKKLTEQLNIIRGQWEEEQKNNKYPVDENDVAEVVSMMTGIPLNKVSTQDNKKLSKLFETINTNLIGQDEAVAKVVKAIKRGRVGLRNPNKPIASFMFIGPTGVGKTQLAKEIAKSVYESEDSLIRLDMSEFGEKIAVTRILGSAPGYVGYDEGSAFLNRVRTKPYSVILFDEIEKAHEDIYSIFLQLLDEGSLTDSHGRKVSFKNCVIIMTSNVGTRRAKEFGSGVGFTTNAKAQNRDSDAKNLITKELGKKFAPEFLNRLSEIIYFNDLGQNDISKIIDVELNKITPRLESLGIFMEIDDALKNHIVEVGYDPSYGARPLERTIQKWIEDPITEKIIDENLGEGYVFSLSYDKETDNTVVKTKKKKQVSK